ncbi:dienelactone hydrolase family protein [Nonomuraea sp. WAC 01424]|uniref:dienelactone hydrolase family protein n=1 Tax=Nonomuraea sp. WAC 01424 TaxID=2203200 RepID=UPI00163C36EC|nr:dienelactone hydrolase family protein [Nonomuraea sp. WAC 01424]
MNGRITTGWVDIAGMTAYTALPVGVRRPVGVLVAGEIFGVSGYVRRMADRLAGLGHAVVVPDFNHRHGLRAGVTGGPKGRVVELPADAAGRERGLELAWLLRREQVLSDAGAALEHLRQVGADPAAAVGFSLGGHVVCSVAGELGLRAAVALYPGWLTGTQLPLSRPVPTLELAARAAGRLVVLLGADDPIIDAGQQRAIAERLETVVFAGAGHGFAADERDSFHADSAREAWKLIEEVLGRAGE